MHVKLIQIRLSVLSIKRLGITKIDVRWIAYCEIAYDM